MKSDLETSKERLIEKELLILAELHPTYTRAQLREARDNLIHYYDFVWKVFLRMREDGRLEKIFSNTKHGSNTTTTSPSAH
jgi:hypothetical protein